MCNILIVYFTRKQWGNTDNLFISMALYGYTVIARGAKQGGGVGGVSTPPEFWMGGGGVEHLSTPLILRKKF